MQIVDTPQRQKVASLQPTNMSEDEFLYGGGQEGTDSHSNSNAPDRRVSIEGPQAGGDSIEITVPGAQAAEDGISDDRRVVKTSGPMATEQQTTQVGLLSRYICCNVVIFGVKSFQSLLKRLYSFDKPNPQTRFEGI